MLIICEGPDRVGKSTFIREARTMIDSQGRRVVSMHRGAPSADSSFLKDYAAPISTYSPAAPRDKTTHSMICDRLHLGDRVYGPIYRGECRGTPAMQMFMDGLIEARGGVKIHMTASAKLIEKRIQEEGEENSYLKIKDVNTIVETYKKICATGWVDIDTTSWETIKQTRDAAKIVVGWAADREREMLPVFSQEPEYIGPRRPKFLVVGDDVEAREHTHRRHGRSYASFTPWPGTAAEYLLNSLIDAGYDIGYDVGLTGVNNGGRNLAGLRAALGMPHIISVGLLAEMVVQRETLRTYAEVAHPVVEMNINGDDNSRYVKLLKEIRESRVSAIS